MVFCYDIIKGESNHLCYDQCISNERSGENDQTEKSVQCARKG